MLERAIGTRGVVLGSRSWLRRALLCLKGGGLLLKRHRYSPKRDGQNWHGRLFHIPVRSGCVNHIGQTARGCGTGHSHGRGTVFGGPWPWALGAKGRNDMRTSASMFVINRRAEGAVISAIITTNHMVDGSVCAGEIIFVR